MICKNKRCRAELPDDAKFCFRCGKPQGKKKVKKKRANGAGCITFRKDVKSTPYVVYGPSICVNGAYTRKKIGAFADAEEAQAALDAYVKNPIKDPNITLSGLYERYINTPQYTKLNRNTKNSYSAAWLKLRKLHKKPFKSLRASDYQPIIDYYKDTHQKEGKGGILLYDSDGEPIMREGGLSKSSLHDIKVLLGRLYTFALSEDIVSKNYSEFIDTTKDGETGTQTRFSDIHVEIMRQNLGKINYIDYAYILCYTGHRIEEFLTFTKEDFYESKGIACLYGGNKTDAGRRKVIPLHPKILPLVKKCMERGGETIFCNLETGKKISVNYFRKKFYYQALEAAGLPLYSPNSCRRTFATRLSAAGVSDDDHIALMGHVDKEVDREHYIIQELSTLYDAVKRLS